MSKSFCDWTEDREYWAAACGQLWAFVDGGPEDNNVRYCHYCGRPVRVLRTDYSAPDPDAEEA
jgi:hypothetical protein